MKKVSTYVFRTNIAVSHPYANKFWCDNFIPEARITANSLSEALKLYYLHAERSGAEISTNAKRHKDKMYLGACRQIGWVIRAKTLVSDRSANYEGYIRIQLWVECTQEIYPFDAD